MNPRITGPQLVTTVPSFKPEIPIARKKKKLVHNPKKVTKWHSNGHARYKIEN